MNEAPKHTSERDGHKLAPTADHGIETDSGTEDMVASQVLWDSSLAASRLDEAIGAAEAARDDDQAPSVPQGDPPAHQERHDDHHDDAGPEHGEKVSRRTHERAQELRRPHRNR
ncbi:hypothetical protein AB0B89_32930 [Sphaerisporangium sp. NPDC049002]|uniref:hypothetical protein n=1 Tax=unclassified Sphaerisporangium TaxID=2630420 RepID=UPI0033F5A429